MIQPRSIKTWPDPWVKIRQTSNTCHNRIRCTQDKRTTLISFPCLLIVSLIDLSPSGTLLLQHSPTIALMRCLCCYVCVGMSVCARICVRLRKKDVSDPCGPVYLHPCVGVEGGQRQGCLYPSPFPRLLSHRHSGHRRMKRLWIFFFSSSLHPPEQED